MNRGKDVARDTEALKQAILQQMQKEMEEFAGGSQVCSGGCWIRGIPRGSSIAL